MAAGVWLAVQQKSGAKSQPFQIKNGANLLNVNPFRQRIITGFLIIAIVFFDQLRRRKG